MIYDESEIGIRTDVNKIQLTERAMFDPYGPRGPRLLYKVFVQSGWEPGEEFGCEARCTEKPSIQEWLDFIWKSRRGCLALAQERGVMDGTFAAVSPLCYSRDLAQGPEAES